MKISSLLPDRIDIHIEGSAMKYKNHLCRCLLGDKVAKNATTRASDEGHGIHPEIVCP